MKKLKSNEIERVGGGGVLKCGRAVAGTIFFGATTIASGSLVIYYAFKMSDPTYGIKAETDFLHAVVAASMSGYMAAESMDAMMDSCFGS